MAFDPYSDWLDIPSGRRPPDCFDLLGVAADEADPVQLLQAAETRMEMARPHLEGPHGDEAQRLLNELARAVDCLTDPVRRAQHEMDLLRQGRRQPDELAEPPGPDGREHGREQGPDDSLCARTLAGSAAEEGAGSTAVAPIHSAAKEDAAPSTRGRIAQVGLALGVAVVLAGGTLGFYWAVTSGGSRSDGVTTPRQTNHQQSRTIRPPAKPTSPDSNLPTGSRGANTRTTALPVAPVPSTADPSHSTVVAQPAAAATQARPPEIEPPEVKPAQIEPTEVEPVDTGDPFRDLPTAVELPPLGSHQPVCWGLVHAGGVSDWKLSLLWDESGLKRNRQFVTESLKAPNGAADGGLSWRIGLRESPRGLPASETDVAEIEFRQGRLSFAWAQEADADWSGFLCNCVLQLDVNGKTHAISLTRAARVDPLVVDLKQGRANSLIRIPWPPDAGALRFEITGVEGRFLSEGLQPPEPAEPKAPIPFSVARKDRHDTQREGVAFEIRFLSSRAGLTVHLSLLAPSADDFRQISSFGAEHPTQPRALRQSLLDRQRLATDSLRLATSRRKASFWNEQLDGLDRRLWYEDFFYHTHGRARIDFRLFLQVGPHEVQLATTRAE